MTPKPTRNPTRVTFGSPPPAPADLTIALQLVRVEAGRLPNVVTEDEARRAAAMLAEIITATHHRFGADPGAWVELNLAEMVLCVTLWPRRRAGGPGAGAPGGPVLPTPTESAEMTLPIWEKA